jgi:type III restriction enzyme
MRYVLTDYQEVATAEVVKRLRQSSREFSADGDYSSVSLTAPTGAGKTVIAAAVVERLFFGDEFSDPDPRATVLWITDNPSLNEQTRRKMLMASTDLKPAHLVTIEAGFDHELLSTNRVYFLNIQKLGKATSFIQSGTDARTWSLWQTIGRSIKGLGGHLYVVIDEAHRGTGSVDRSRPTIVSRIISDPSGELPPTPIVWGISATPERFQEAMAVASSPVRTQREVRVPAEEVRASGLLKDSLDIRHPDDTQPSNATLTRLAANNLKEMSERWDAYATDQSEPVVKPVLVVQVKAQESDAAISEILNTLKDAWPVLSGRAVGHSFDTHSTLNIDGQTVRYIAPQDIQDDSRLRVVLFKEALTTGWDCPRAETMLSFRKAEDYTYIAQLIGRMVRTPLARRITTDDVLNSVSLFLPHYDKDSVQEVVNRLQADPDSPPLEILRNAFACGINPALRDDAIEVIKMIPTYVVPGKAHKSQVARLHTLATRLAGDGIVEKAVTTADEHLVATIERERARLANDGTYDALIAGLGRIDIGRLKVSLIDGTQIRIEEHSSPDARDINNVFKAARRGFRDGLSSVYWAWLLDQNEHSSGDDFLLPDDGKLIVAALASDAAVVEAVENAAGELVRRWLKDHARAISQLPAAAKAAYQTVRAQAKESEETTLTLPSAISVGSDTGAPTWAKHVYCPDNGDFPAVLNTWEAQVVQTELDRGAIAWYRNPTGGERAIRVPYQDGEFDKALYPDFVFVHDGEDGPLASIIDPHNYALSDSGPKLRGLGAYAEKHGRAFQRIESVIRDPRGPLLLLDLKDATIRNALASANSNDEILAVFQAHGGIY